MSRRPSVAASIVLAAAAGAACLALALAGCGEKIALPHAEGLFSTWAWGEDEVYADARARQLDVSQGALFVVAPDSLVKRDLSYNQIAAVGGLTDATAVCVTRLNPLVFVWDQGTHSLHWYASADLTELGSATLGAVQNVRAMAADTAGISQVPGARTFVYLSDPDSLVVHRYAFDDFNGPTSHGILTFATGLGARSVHEAAGMAIDSEGRLLVCDTDPLRNWVIRFDATPDLTDFVTPPSAPRIDYWRGTAVPFVETCVPPAAADYTLGNAAPCDPTGWVGGPSSANGEFDAPTAVVADGSGHIFVADYGNDRIQVFSSDGVYFQQFGTEVTCQAPSSLALTDIRVGTGVDDVMYGAYVYVLTAGTGQVHRFISSDYYGYLYHEPPPHQP